MAVEVSQEVNLEHLFASQRMITCEILFKCFDEGNGIILYVLFTSINMSTDSLSPLMGSVLFSWMYFSIRRRSKMQPDTGERTGCSGTSLLTAKGKARLITGAFVPTVRGSRFLAKTSTETGIFFFFFFF